MKAFDEKCMECTGKMRGADLELPSNNNNKDPVMFKRNNLFLLIE